MTANIIIRNLLLNNQKNLLIKHRKINITAVIKATANNNNTTLLKTSFISKNLNSFQIKSIGIREIMSYIVKPKVVFVLGGPGAGKGTQCQKIVEKYGFVHLSAGDLLREERAREGSEYGQLIESYIKDGKIVPVEITCSLLENAMNKSMQGGSGKNKFLIDGFPRNKDNLEGWQRKMSKKVNLLFVLFFDCSEDICIERCLNRGQSGSGRSDDNLESLKKRIQTYQNDSLPIIEYYMELDLVRKIDATQNADEVFSDVESAFAGVVSSIVKDNDDDDGNNTDK